MFTISKTYQFEASHRLMRHEGKCHNLHGHSYKLTIELVSPTLHTEGPQTNMVQDFGHVSAVVKKLIHSHLDHRHLNDTLETESPTAEFIAYWVFHRLKPSLPLLAAIKLQETQSAGVEYRPSPKPYPHPVDPCSNPVILPQMKQLQQQPQTQPQLQPHEHHCEHGVRPDDDEPRSDDAQDSS